MKHMFLQGPICSGKSTLLRDALIDYLPSVGGFFVQRLFVGDRYRAFSLNTFTTPDRYILNKNVPQIDHEKGVFLYCRDDGQWEYKLDVFEIYGALCLEQGIAEGKKIMLLDEVGGIDLYCSNFVQTLQKTLDDDICCQPVQSS